MEDRYTPRRLLLALAFAVVFLIVLDAGSAVLAHSHPGADLIRCGRFCIPVR